MSLERPAPQDVVVIGASGDLSRRKLMPALYNLAASDLLPSRGSIIGLAPGDLDDERFREFARGSIEEFSRTGFDQESWAGLSSRLTFVRLDEDGYQRLAQRARDLQIMYGLEGERRLTETELSELDGYRSSRPVRIGNAAYSQFQLDIYGEVMDSAHLYRKFGGEMDPEYWEYLQRVIAFVIDHWREPDEGIWETRGGRQHFVSSKAWCWVALDRAIKAARALGLPGDVEHWRQVRAEIKEDVLANGYDAERGAFVQAYGSEKLDASNLLLPLVGFVRIHEPRMRATIEAIERELTSPEGFVFRYEHDDDDVAGREGTFSICAYWLADNLIALGELQRARALFDKLRESANDLGLFSEETEPETGAMLGNFPQAFTHLAFINTAVQLHEAEVHRRGSA